jgi:predicted nucleic acid-binding protein
MANIQAVTNFMNVLDTNIWIYVHDSCDPRNQAIAQRLTTTTKPLALPWQVGCEFIAATRKLAPLGFTEDFAWQALTAMRTMADRVLLPVEDIWSETDALRRRFTLGFWDAILVAACLHDGVSTLYTEDFPGWSVIDTLTLVNPFATP